MKKVILKFVEKERAKVAFFQLVKWVVYIIEGRFAAYFVGWKKGYLGRGSRVIGTRSIWVEDRVSIGRYAWIEAISEHFKQTYTPVIKIGKGFVASERLHISAINRVEIGESCLFGSGVYISDHNHGGYKGEEQSRPSELPIMRALISTGPIIIGSNVWLGDNVIIAGHVSIGDGVVIGANSVVTHDMPANVIAVGSPAKIIKQFDANSGKWEAVEKS